MDDMHPRPVLNFLAGLALVLVLSFAGVVGYYSAACSDSSQAVGSAILLLMFGPIVFPAAGIAALGIGGAVAFIGSVFLQPAKSIERFGVACLMSVAAALAIFVVSEKIAQATDAYARCSMGF